MGPGEPDTSTDTERAAEEPPRFTPLRRASPSRRAALFTVGPLLWVAAIAVAAYVLHHARSIEIALIVLGAALLLSVVTLLPMRARRVREERER